MASRIMHLCIAKKIGETITFANKEHFYIGNLVPDLTRWGNGDYDRSHFCYSKANYRGINYLDFLRKYRVNGELSDYKTGYFIHLLADAIWLKTIQEKHVRIHKNKEGVYKLGYNDMYKLNPILISKYNLEERHLKRVEEEIDEISLSCFGELVHSLRDDFLSDYIDEDMQVYPVESICSFIDEAVEICTHSISKLRNGMTLEDPSMFYVQVRHESNIK